MILTRSRQKIKRPKNKTKTMAPQSKYGGRLSKSRPITPRSEINTLSGQVTVGRCSSRTHDGCLQIRLMRWGRWVALTVCQAALLRRTGIDEKYRVRQETQMKRQNCFAAKPTRKNAKQAYRYETQAGSLPAFKWLQKLRLISLLLFSLLLLLFCFVTLPVFRVFLFHEKTSS